MPSEGAFAVLCVTGMLFLQSALFSCLSHGKEFIRQNMDVFYLTYSAGFVHFIEMVS